MVSSFTVKDSSDTTMKWQIPTNIIEI
jgi:hypothetical protein